MKLYLTDTEWLESLKRHRDYLSTAFQLQKDDSNYPGNKYTYCNWGMCWHDASLWPKELWMFPNLIHGNKCTPLHREHNHYCPLDYKTFEEKDINDPNGSWGCFSRCKAFNDKTLTLQDAMLLYDQLINLMELPLDQL